MTNRRRRRALAAPFVLTMVATGCNGSGTKSGNLTTEPTTSVPGTTTTEPGYGNTTSPPTSTVNVTAPPTPTDG